MKIELHFLQNFAPSNLNRDDTGAPKDCEFGGYRRARISSQCLKRAMREAFARHRLFGESTTERLAARTKRLIDETSKLLVERGKLETDAHQRVTFALQGAELKVKDERETEYLLFVPRRLVSRLADVVATHWDVLDGTAAAPEAQPHEASSASKKQAKKKADGKKAAKGSVPKEVTREVVDLFADSAKTPDLALFGRMIADNPDWNVDAACQVAHAISTNRVSMEFDFYTAVDDLKPRDDAGAGMMGTIAFQSACFYRYACLDVDALRRNLGGTNEGEAMALARETVEAFLRASALAIPSGKQNSMAAQNLPSYMLAVVRAQGAPQSLANAFAKPVRPSAESSLIDTSVGTLEAYLSRTVAVWGAEGLKLFSCRDVDGTPASIPAHEPIPTFQGWVERVLAAGVPS